MDKPETITPEIAEVQKTFRWDLYGLILAIAVSIGLVFVLDTGELFAWIARHKDSKLDEALVAGAVILFAFTVIFVRRWLGISRKLVRYSSQPQSPEVTWADNAKRVFRLDVIGVCIALALAGILVFVFDTGELAEWVARQKETKVDECIVMAIVLLLGLTFFSVRRWMEFSNQLQRYEELHKSTVEFHRETVLLGELGDLLQSCLSSEEAYQLITSRAQLLLQGTSGALCVIANSRNMVEVVSQWGQPAIAERVFAPPDCWALRRGRVHLFQDSQSALACSHIAPVRPQNAVCVPMMAHGESLGLFYVDYRSEESNRPGTAASSIAETVERLTRTLAEQAAMALANLKLREILRIQSVRDPLTNLYNRRYMEESMDRELSRSARKKSSLGLLMLDVDHFKRFNDTSGHEAGDMVLRAIAASLRAQLRAEDIVCRYGGEEFAIILPEAPLEACRKRAEQLRETIKALRIEYRGQLLEELTVSIGVASFPEDGSVRDVLMRAADAALYRAKAKGRDCVIIAERKEDEMANY